MTVYTVTSNMDSGPGTLRDAINNVNDDFLPDTIDFAIGRGPQRIQLQSALPTITNQVTIDGTSQPGYSTTTKVPQIVIDGAQTGDPGQVGISIQASDSIVEGLAIINSGDAGIFINADSVGVYSNYIGIDPIQSVVAPNGTYGISLFFASNNIIGAPGQGNLIAGNTSNGIYLTVVSADNLIQGNAIGTTFPKSNGGSGISLAPQNIGNEGSGISLTAVSGNTIGGSTAGAGNTISGNVGPGIDLQGGSATLIQGNTIGLDAAGVIDTSNGSDGITIANSTGDTVGGSVAGAGNLISGNNGNGISSSGGSSLLVQGNTIGTDVTGELNKGNAGDGIMIQGSAGTTIGGSTPGAGNLISANSGDGIALSAATSTVTPSSANNAIATPKLTTPLGNLILGNTIGIDLAGTRPLGNGTGGISLTNTPNNTIGGTVRGAGNLISANLGDGIDINGSAASGNLIEGNTVGTNATNSTNSRFGNASNGINVQDSANNTIGGTVSGSGNLLVLNQVNGILLSGGGATGNLVVGNRIGTDLAGDGFLGNFRAGIDLESAPKNTIGGTTGSARNLIVSSGTDAIDIQSSMASPQGTIIAADGNLVQGNDIGIALGVSGNQVFLPNANDGLFIVASNNTIGGTAAGSGNVISLNNSDGINIGSAQGESGVVVATGNVILNNIIGLDASGTQQAGNGRNGIQLSGAYNTVVSGNVISGNTTGIDVLSSTVTANAPLGDLIVGNIIGLGSDGLTLTPAGQGASLKNTSNGITVESSAEGVTIGGSATGQGNVISGNGASGILFTGGAFADLAIGNLIGVGKDGLTSRANNQSGVMINDASTGITIGGSTFGSGNVISGNSIGLTIANSGTADNLIEGNLIGLAIDGLTEVSNLSYGVLLIDGVTGNTIGGTSTGSRNVISANGQGIGIIGPGSNGNVVEGNVVGLDASGSLPRGNLQAGVFLNQASNNTIGGSSTGAGNLVSGNSGTGIVIFGPNSVTNVVAGNLVGLNASGTSTVASTGATLGNSGFGIQVENSPSNTIGGSTSGSGNVVSGNRQGGIDIDGASAAFNVIEANRVGLDSSGTKALPNLADGIQVANAPANVIGGVSPATRNVVSGNVGSGIEIDGSGAFFDEVLGNYVGTDASGLVGLGNGLSGVFINGAPGVTIGGTIAGLGNLISGNVANGVQISGAGSAGTLVLGNSIGVDARGQFPIGNGNDGVLFDGTTAVTVGGTVPGAGNLISGNLSNGVEFGGNGSTNDILQGNRIGTDASGSTALANGTGVFVNGSAGNLIGGTAPFSGNLISGNTGPGVHIFGLGALNNAVEGNRIGTNLLGVAPLANQAGVFLDVAPSNVVSGNLLSGNAAAGVVIEGATATSNLVQGNLIGLDVSGSRAIGSSTPQQSGVLIDNAPGNVIGGSTPATRNVISGNTAGVVIAGFAAQGNLVLGNLIGLDATGRHAVANGTGVYINGASSNTIGGTIVGATNIISGNTAVGVYLYGTQSTGNVVAANFIGTDATGTVAVPNQNGIYFELASNNTIGGSVAGAGNLVSGNTVAGIYLYNQAIGNLIERNTIGIGSTGKRLGNLQYGVLLYNAASNTVPTTGGNANTIANSGIGNFREFTGAVPTTSSTTTSSVSKKSKTKVVTTRSVHPAGPKGSTSKVNHPGSA